MASGQYVNLRVTNKMVLPVNTNLATINGQSLIELRESVDMALQPANQNALFGETVIGVAGTDITMVNIGTAFTIAWDNTIHTIGWTQVGTLITFTDGSLFAGGEEIKITYTI